MKISAASARFKMDQNQEKSCKQDDRLTKIAKNGKHLRAIWTAKTLVRKLGIKIREY